MYYEINVAKNGRHFFATDKRSITNKRALKEVYSVFKEKFPQEEGYDMIVSYVETKGKHIDMEQEELSWKEL
jgi:hypothetical protein